MNTIKKKKNRAREVRSAVVEGKWQNKIRWSWQASLRGYDLSKRLGGENLVKKILGLPWWQRL